MHNSQFFVSVKIRINHHSFRFAYDIDYCIKCSFLNTLHALELFYECGLCRRPNPPDAVKLTDGLSFRTSVTMMRDAEAMRFVAHRLDYAKARTGLVDV